MSALSVRWLCFYNRHKITPLETDKIIKKRSSQSRLPHQTCPDKFCVPLCFLKLPWEFRQLVMSDPWWLECSFSQTSNVLFVLAFTRHTLWSSFFITVPECNDRMFEISHQDWGSLNPFILGNGLNHCINKRPYRLSPLPLNNESILHCQGCVYGHIFVSFWRVIEASSSPPDTSREIPSVFYLEEPADLCTASRRSSSRTGSEYVLRRMQVWGGDECCHESDRGGEKWAHTTEISHEEGWPVHRPWVKTVTVWKQLMSAISGIVLCLLGKEQLLQQKEKKRNSWRKGCNS